MHGVGVGRGMHGDGRNAELLAGAQDAQALTATREFADQFEVAARQAKSPRRVANLIQSELMGRLKAKGLELEQSPITLKGLVQAADLAERDGV